MMELLDAFRMAEGKGTADIPDQSGADVWVLICIEAISRKGWRNSVSAVLLGAENGRSIVFSFEPTMEVVQEGDIISLRENEISLFDTMAMKPKRYKITIEREYVLSSDED
jgi:hypothetical protein